MQKGKKDINMETDMCLSPVSEARAAAVSDTAYGWFSLSCWTSAQVRPYEYETEDGHKVLAHGVCGSPTLPNIAWHDKQCVGRVKTKTAKKSKVTHPYDLTMRIGGLSL